MRSGLARFSARRTMRRLRTRSAISVPSAPARYQRRSERATWLLEWKARVKPLSYSTTAVWWSARSMSDWKASLAPRQPGAGDATEDIEVVTDLVEHERAAPFGPAAPVAGQVRPVLRRQVLGGVHGDQRPQSARVDPGDHL